MSYGCMNRAPFKESFTLHGISKETGEMVKTVIPFRMSMECDYALHDKYSDPGCNGCAEKVKALARREAN